MTTPTPTPADEALAHDERWALTLRIIASHHLGKAIQLRELLLFLAKRAIECPQEEVTEQEIGCRVLGRRRDYNPQADNIVRVQIRRLRQKLEEYFLTDGRSEPITISIPKGSHVLHFEPRIEVAAPGPPVVLPVISPKPQGWKFGLKLAIPILLLVAALAFFIGRESNHPANTATLEQKDTAHPLWSRIFRRDQPTSIVIADSSLVIINNVLQRSIRLNEYIDRSYRDLIESAANPELRQTLQMISHRQYTSLADAKLSGELSSLGAQWGSKVGVRYARHLNIRDFNSGNFILLGSSHGVPWVELFEPNLNFQFERIGKEQRFGFRNKQPNNGEAAVYESSIPSNAPQQSFATISLVPNLSRNGAVLLLTGITMEATEAAGEFAMTADFAEALSTSFGVSPDKQAPYFELLLKATSMAGAPHKVDVVAWRKLSF